MNPGKLADWVVWYSDGSSFSSLEGDPGKAPRMYVECIAVADRSCGAYVVADYDFYCWQDAQWVPHDRLGLFQYLASPGTEKIVLFGYAMDRTRYAAVRAQALRDERLPKVTAKGPRQAPEGI